MMMGSLFRFWRVAVLLVLLLLAAVVVPMKILDSDGVERVERLREDLEELNTANRRLERENDSLRREIRLFHSNPEYIEKIARDELGMVGPGEVVFQFPESRRSGKQNTQ